MLLLIAVANARVYGYGHPLGVRFYPRELDGVDRVVALIQMTLVDGRAYPLFALLFGYGIGQLTRRRAAAGVPASRVTRLVQRRGLVMVAIGLVHGVLLWSGDIVGAYGLLAVVMAGLLVRGSDGALLRTAGVGVALTTLLFAAAGFSAGDADSALPSVAAADPGTAVAMRALEWAGTGLLVQAVAVVAAVALGGWAARRRLLDEPERHRRLLSAVALTGISAAVLGGLPLALMAAQLWTSPPVVAVLAAGSLHELCGYAGGAGYAALFGLVAIRLARRAPGPVTRAMLACGRRSLSCYLAQSVAFVALLPAWTLGLGRDVRLWQTALLGIGAWLVILLVAAASDRAGCRGPAETMLRRFTYGRQPTAAEI